MSDNLKAALLKLFDMWIDGRAIFAVIMLLVSFGGLEWSADRAEAVDAQVVGIVKMIAYVVGPLLTGGIVVHSWGNRPRSGLSDYKSAAPPIPVRPRLEEQVKTALEEAGVKIVDDTTAAE